MGIATGIQVVTLFIATKEFSVPLALIALGGLLVGTFLSIAALVFHAVARLRSIVNGSRQT
jgi:uncharacterized integral membrane protein